MKKLGAAMAGMIGHAVGFLLCGLAAAWAGDVPSVVVLVNAASEASCSVGAHYAARRGVPDDHICRVRCTTSEVVSRERFEADIRTPLRTFLLDADLATARPDGRLALRVRYLVSAYGIPVKVREDYRHLKPEDLPRRGFRRNAASVDSELALVGLPGHPLDGPAPNPAWRNPGARGSILLATRLDGPTPQVAKRLVEDAIRAEAEGLLGIGYVDARGTKHPGYRRGDEWLLPAAAALKQVGLFTRVDRAERTFDPDMPMPDAAFYFGWYRETLCGPMAARGFRFPTGAVAYHLHSGSAARLRTIRLGWAGPLLDRGATATMGAVFEPLLQGTPDVGEFARRFLAGHSFAESAYAASRQLSWMMTYVGDPLYAPFRADRLRAALARKENARWRDVRDALHAAGRKKVDAALETCGRHELDPLFVELAGRVLFQAGRRDEAMDCYRTLARLVEDDYSAIQAFAVVGDWLAAAGEKRRALETFLACLRARDHRKSSHALPVYRKGIRLARGLHDGSSEVWLWRRLVEHFPGHALGRFAAGELWLRDLGPEPPLPRVEVPRVAKPPAIDGKPDDAAWAEAPVIGRLPYRRAGTRQVAGRTTVRLLRDDAALYVLAEVRPAPAAPIVADETFELSLSPWRDAVQSTVFSVPRSGRAVIPLRGTTWRVGPLPASEPSEPATAGWAIELRIPFAAFGLEEVAADSVWSANFVHRCTVPRFPFRMVPTAASWARMDADPLAPECAGHLIFR
jgi:uncharacterized protein (TIGR03790 family)